MKIKAFNSFSTPFDNKNFTSQESQIFADFNNLLKF